MPKTVKIKIVKDPKDKKTKKAVKSDVKPIATEGLKKTEKVEVIPVEKEIVKTDMSVLKLLPDVKKDEVNQISKIRKLDLKETRGKFIEKFQSINSKSKKFKKIYIALSTLVIIVTLFLLIVPLFPAVTYSFNPPTDKVKYKLPASAPVQSIDNPKAVPSENRLIIPKIGVDTPIVDGANIDILNSEEGVWRELANKNPTEKGNMTLAGHRFQYLPPNMTTFYNLDKVQTGDIAIVFWEGKSYIYQVYTTFEVTPDHVEILDDSKDVPYELTLYTCTPIYTSTDRLIVKAKLLQ